MVNYKHERYEIIQFKAIGELGEGHTGLASETMKQELFLITSNQQ